jgi:hypothetical protein
LKKIKQLFYPEDLIAFFFTFIVLTVQVILLLLNKTSGTATLVQLLAAAITFTAFILISKQSKNRYILFLRTYLHIPYYAVIFTTFEDYLHRLNPVDWDWLLLKADYAVLGFDVTVWLEKINTPIVTELLIISYFSYYLLPTLSAVVFYFILKRENVYGDLRYFVLALIIGWYTAFIFYAALPAAGPDIAFPENYSAELKGLSFLTNYYLQTVTSYLRESAVRNTFPSMHFAIILMVNYFAFRWNKKYFWLCTLPLGTGLAIATMYLRQHYFIDLVGSVPMAWLSVWLAGRWVNEMK